MASNGPSFLSVMHMTEDECRAFFEARCWSNGPRCPKCGDGGRYHITRKSATKNHVKSVYRCRACRKDYTVTIGTIFEDSDIPLNKWCAAIYLMVGSKKGISAHHLMAHRIGEAMRDRSLPLLTGTAEVDETCIGGKKRGPFDGKVAFAGMPERGGKARTTKVDAVNTRRMGELFRKNIDTENPG